MRGMMKMLRNVTRLKCWVLIVALLFILPGSAMASKSYREVKAEEQYVVNTYGLKVFKAPSLKSEVLETVPYARNVKCFAIREGWAKVYTVNRVIGYCQTQYLTAINPNTYNTTMYCQQSASPYYYRPDVNSALMGHLYRDEAVKVVAITPLGDWVRIRHEDSWFYVQRPCMDTAKYVKGKAAWCAKESMKVYYNPEMTTKMGTLYFGQEFLLVDQKGSIAKIRSKSGIIGYCKLSEITPTNPNKDGQTVYTQVDGNYLFKSSTSLSGRVQIKKNEALKLLAIDDNHYWARVEYKGANYYVPVVYLDTKRRSSDYKQIVARTGLNIRTGTKKSSDIVATVPTGTQLWLIGATDTCARVATSPDASGQFYTGYVELAYLK